MKIKYRFKDTTYTILKYEAPSPRKPLGKETFYFVLNVPCDLPFTSLVAAKQAIKDGTVWQEPADSFFRQLDAA